MGHPVLLETAARIEDPSSSGIATLIGDMIETLDDAGGIGLAAPQVHMPLRIVLLEIPENRTSEDVDDCAEPLTVMINPEIEPAGTEKILGLEACLSLPGMLGAVPRFSDITYRWTAPDGSAMERQASGFHARVVQHECDHLDGVLYPMRMTDLTFFGFAEEIHRNRELMDRIKERDE
jgi:peptide deformylase